MTISTNKYDRKLILTYAVIASIIVGFLFLRSFFGLIAVSLILAFIFSPIYRWFQKRTKNDTTAATLTFLVNALCIILPLVLVVYVTILQAGTMIEDINQSVSGQDASELLVRLLEAVNRTISSITGQSVNITVNDVSDQIASYGSTLAYAVLDILQGWAGSLGSIITNVILYIYIFIATLVHQDKLIKLFKGLNPLGEDISNVYLQLTGDMTKGMIKGQFIIATCQGLTSAVILHIAGMPYFAFWFLILSFMSLIPLGAGIITIPIGVGMILLGNTWQGLIVILGHLLLVTNIDNVLRPILVPKSVRLNPALTLLAVFAGIAVFGFLGIVVGPIIMILIITTFNIYINELGNDAGKPSNKLAK